MDKLWIDLEVFGNVKMDWIEEVIEIGKFVVLWLGVKGLCRYCRVGEVFWSLLLEIF